MYIKDSDIQVERPYTPLEGIDARGQLHFWVKRYEGGEVGRWLHERKVGEKVEMRGPVHIREWRDGEWDEVVMVRTERLACYLGRELMPTRYQAEQG